METSNSQVKALAHCLLEEFESHGGHFESPDTDIIFRQAFMSDWGDGNTTTKEALHDLIKEL